MNFTPKTEAELNPLWPIGEYDFEITHAEEKLSKQMNEMIELKVILYKGEESKHLNDFLMEKIAYKLRHCADACGLLHQYESGILEAEMLIGKTGKCKVGIQKDKEGKYPDKNVIQDYVKSSKAVYQVAISRNAPRTRIPLQDNCGYAVHGFPERQDALAVSAQPAGQDAPPPTDADSPF